MLENFEISQKMIVKVGYCIPIPVDTGRKLNVHKTFRRPSGCLLNVLRTRSIYVLFLRGYGFFLSFSLHVKQLHYAKIRLQNTFLQTKMLDKGIGKFC